jgi:hypothetical protein
MSDQEHSQESEEREETIEDLDVPDEQGEDVTGGHEGFKVSQKD